MKLIWEVTIPAALNRDREVTINNRRIWASLGPLDVPREVIVTRQDKRVQMELHYAFSPDENELTVQNGSVRVTLGRESGRVFFLQCDSGELLASEFAKPLQQMATSALALTAYQRPQRRYAHYTLIADDILPHVIEQVNHELILESR